MWKIGFYKTNSELNDEELKILDRELLVAFHGWAEYVPLEKLRREKSIETVVIETEDIEKCEKVFLSAGYKIIKKFEFDRD